MYFLLSMIFIVCLLLLFLQVESFITRQIILGKELEATREELKKTANNDDLK